jgi:tetratricopeptide (TPR) repeat protein
LNDLTRVTLHSHGETDAAERYADEAIRVSQEAGIEWAGAVAYEMKGIIAYHRKDYDEARTLFEKAFHAYEEISAHFNVILAKSTLAHMERELGNHRIALNIYRETILAFRDAAQTGAVAHQLECFGFIALAQNHAEHALQLLAAANALRKRAGTSMAPDEQVYFDEQLGRLREKMSVAEFKKAWEDGSMMTMGQAITFALEAESI